ncbi:endonuclease/exonuclease/phosphatase family protein [Solitalea sp. MAHUQ-68]|uniref:Endonuclease/exonuclease/phosphatase family protein n=1 Tax=Solitalea agri TaxID=2953739 RepID=A0A9X2F3V4_9SPHI|nr:endonuclease/exonuclease/phosphatase family protein [Solitalea agri]MCO4291886.1 endonuclease/exonuclease/phosphatase family protein [Solitalea agri]
MRGKRILMFGLCMWFGGFQIDLAFAKGPKTEGDTLRILTYNVHHCNPPGKTIIDVPAIINVVKQSNASIVALQEIDVNTSRSGKELNEAEAIANACGMYFCFGKALDFAGGGYGVAILSKFPISEVQCYNLPKDAKPQTEQRVLLTATLSLSDKKQIRFANTHLDVQSAQNRELQINEIIKIIKAGGKKVPFLIAGDFNDTPNSSTINLLDKNFQRSCIDCEPTVPQDIPHQTIDFIAFEKHLRKKIAVVKHTVIEETYASDHRPVYAELLIKH